MGWIGRWWRRLRLLVGRGRDADVAEEMRLHLELEAEALIDRGMDPEEARREALRRFGNVDRHREGAREARGTRWLEDLAQDVRFALRTLRGDARFTSVALVTLTLGIGATTAIFSVVNAVLLRPLPYGEPDRVVRLHAGWEGGFHDLSPAEYFDLRRDLDAASHVAAYAFGALNLSGDGDPARVRTVFAAAALLPTLGVEPLLGRSLTEDEDLEDRPVVLVSHAFWQGRLGGDPDVLGRSVVLNDVAREVVGVLPPGFRLPEDMASGDRTEIVAPLGLTPRSVPNRGSHFLDAVARLAPGVAPEAGARAVEALAEQWVRDHPEDYPETMGFFATAVPLTDDVLGAARPVVWVLTGAVAFLLLIVCANVANLLLARAESRRREMSVRVALGAGRGRLVRQLVVESLVLAVTGGLLGMALALVGTEVLVGLVPDGLTIPRLREVGADPLVLAFAVGAALLTGVAFGLVPAMHAVRGADAGSLRAGSRGGSPDGDAHRLRRLLVAGQLAVALVLLAGAGLLTRSFAELLAVDPGFRPENVVTARLSLPAARYPETGQVVSFYRRLEDELEALPAVDAAGAVTNLPLATDLGDLNFRVEGQSYAETERSPAADWQAVTPGYFEAMGMRLLRGRLPTAADGPDAPGVVVINEALARRYWPDRDPLGVRFTLGGGAGPGLVEIVGIVGDITHGGLAVPPRPEMYVPHAQFRFWDSGVPVRALTVVVRSGSPPPAVAAGLRETVGRLDPVLPLDQVRTMEEVVAGALALPRFVLAVLAVFAGLSAVVAGVGVYGVTAYAVGRRTREFGIRLALGAAKGQLAGLVLREGVWTVAAGVMVGAAGALLLTRALSGLLFRVDPEDPATLAAVSALLAGLALLACWLPARRASRVDPVTSLKVE